MAGHCTCCGGSGYRKPAQERARIEVLEAFVARIASWSTLDPTYDAEEGCEAYNSTIKDARKLARGRIKR